MNNLFRVSSIVVVVIALVTTLSFQMSGALASSITNTTNNAIATARTVTGNHLDGSMMCSNGLARNIELVFSGKKEVNEQITGNGTLFVYGYNPVSAHPLTITFNAGKLGLDGYYLLKGKMNESFCMGLGNGWPTSISIYGRCGISIVQSNVQTSDGGRAQLTGNVKCSSLKQSTSNVSSINTVIGETTDGAVECPNGSAAHTTIDFNASQTTTPTVNNVMNGTITLIEYPMFGGTVIENGKILVGSMNPHSHSYELAGMMINGPCSDNIAVFLITGTCGKAKIVNFIASDGSRGHQLLPLQGDVKCT